MATIITQVDHLTGNYETVFTYTIQASFNGIEGQVNNAQIRVFIPDFLQISVGDATNPVQSIREEPGVKGRSLVFDFGAIQDLGIAIRLSFGAQFLVGTPTETGFQTDTQIWVNGSLHTQEISQEIRLQATPDFIVYQERILPVVAPSKGSQVYYRVIIENRGDLGTMVENLTIVVKGNDGFQLDDTFLVVGKDVSQQKGDSQQDNSQGIITSNGLTFELPVYWGAQYEFVYRGIILDSFMVGDSLNFPFLWAHKTQEAVTQQETTIIGEKVSQGNLSLYGPRFTVAEAPITYSLTAKNQGNQKLNDAQLQLNLPWEIGFSTLKTATFYWEAIEENVEQSYQIGYLTEQGVTGSLGSFSTKISQEISLENLTEERISTITIEQLDLDVGVSTKTPFILDGTVMSTTALDTAITKADIMVWEGGNDVASKTTAVENTCAILPLVSVSPGGQTAKIGDTIQYTIGGNCSQSRLINPIFAVLLPEELAFSENLSVHYSDHFGGEEPELPPPSVIPNYNDTGETLVKFSFVGEYAFTFPQKSKMKISFDSTVKIGAIGDFVVSALLQTTDGASYYPSNVSTVQIDGRTFAIRYSFWKTVLLFASIASDKKVKGNLDNQYSELPTVGKTTEGGTLEYQLTVKNTGNVPFESVEIVDILPHLGDTGVVVTNVFRDSQFSVLLSTDVVCTLVPTPEKQNFTIRYSNSTNPVRFGGKLDTIGKDSNWKVKPMPGYSQVSALKIATDHTFLHPGEILKIAIRAIAPVGGEVGAVAWNSFAAQGTYRGLDGSLQQLLAVEAEKVGIQVVENPPNRGEIGGFAYLEDTSGETVDDVAVLLCDHLGELVGVTFTAPDHNGNHGHYLFNNMEFGTYTIAFIVDENRYTFVTEEVVEVQLEGESWSNRDIHVGLAYHNPLDYIWKVNQSARKTLRNGTMSQLALAMKLDSLKELF